MKGIKQVEAQSSNPPRLHLPITPPIMRCMKVVWSASAAYPDTKFWAACCSGFFGFLHAGKMMLLLMAVTTPLCTSVLAI